MKQILLRLFFLIFTTALMAQANKVSITNSSDGQRMIVDGKEIMLNGMNWDYIPRGQTIATTAYQFWNEPDDIIKDALDAEMAL